MVIFTYFNPQTQMSRLGDWRWRYDFQQQEGDRQWEISEKDGRAYYLRPGFKAPPHQLLCAPEQKSISLRLSFLTWKPGIKWYSSHRWLSDLLIMSEMCSSTEPGTQKTSVWLLLALEYCVRTYRWVFFRNKCRLVFGKRADRISQCKSEHTIWREHIYI